MSKAKARTLESPYHYIFLQVSPPTEQLSLRYAIQKALQQTFGITRAGIGIDILSEQEDHVVIRVASEDAKYVVSALPTWNNPTMRVLKETPFLPSGDIIADE